MKKTSKTIVFFGNERLVSGLKTTETPVLRGLIEAGYTIAAVVAHHTDASSRNKRPLEVAELAAEHNIPVLLPAKMKDITEQLESFNADAGVLVAFGKIIPQNVIDIFPMGIINIHPSLLPKYRGSTPIESAILNGDSETGVSIMRLTAGMDEGPVFAQTHQKLSGTEDKFTLYKQLAADSTKLLLELLPSILSGNAKPTEQDSSSATYCKLFTKEDAWLTPETMTARDAERHIRACLGFPKSKLAVNGQLIIITKACVVTEAQHELDIAFKNGSFLRVEQLIAPSGRLMDARSFINGYLS